MSMVVIMVLVVVIVYRYWWWWGCKDGHGGDLRLGAEVLADSFADYLQICQDSFAFSLMLMPMLMLIDRHTVCWIVKKLLQSHHFLAFFSVFCFMSIPLYPKSTSICVYDLC